MGTWIYRILTGENYQGGYKDYESVKRVKSMRCVIAELISERPFKPCLALEKTEHNQQYYLLNYKFQIQKTDARSVTCVIAFN